MSSKTILLLCVLIFSSTAIPVYLELTLTCPCNCTHFHGSVLMMESDPGIDDVLNVQWQDFSAEYGKNVVNFVARGQEKDDGVFDNVIEPYLNVRHNCWGRLKGEKIHFPQCNTKVSGWCYLTKEVTLALS